MLPAVMCITSRGRIADDLAMRPFSFSALRGTMAV